MSSTAAVAGDFAGSREAVAPRAASAGLFAARALSAAMSFVVSIYLARTLGSSEFGRYAFVIAFLTFASIFFDLGYFASASTLIANADGRQAYRYINAMVVLGFLFSLVFIGLVLVSSLVVDFIFNVKIGRLLLHTAVLSPALILPYMFEQMLKASGRIHLLSFWVVGTKAVSVLALAYYGLRAKIDAETASIAYMIGGVIVSIFVLALMRPGLSGVRSGLRSISAMQKRFGRPLYVGKIAHLGSYHSDKLMLAGLHRAADVGWYTLAMALAGGISMFAQSVAASAFRQFGKRTQISHRLLRQNTTGLVAGSVLTVLAGAAVIATYLGPEYGPVILLLLPASLATSFQGAFQPYNSWLLANGHGREIRNFLFVVAGINVLGNITLIPLFSVYGAAVASILGMASYWWLARRAYRRALALDQHD